MARFRLALLLFFCARAWAYYVIPYELRVGSPGHEKVYTALVVLADHYAQHYGEQDGLTQVLAENYHSDPNKFLADYLKVPYDWYVEQIEKNTEDYGEQGAALLGKELREHPLLPDGKSSLVIITEHHDLTKILATMRVDTTDEEGMVPSEKNFQDKGLDGERLPKPRVQARWSKISDFEPEAYETDFHPLEYPAAERMHFWIEGENIEMKNFAIDRKALLKFVRPLFLIARNHKMFSWGSGKFPRRLKHWPDGTPIPEEAYEHFGVRASHLWLAAYSDHLRELYAAMGFKVWKTVNNEHTYHLNMYLMSAPVRRADRKTQDNFLKRVSGKDAWLVKDRALSRVLHEATCAADLGKLSSSRARNDDNF